MHGIGYVSHLVLPQTWLIYLRTHAASIKGDKLVGLPKSASAMISKEEADAMLAKMAEGSAPEPGDDGAVAVS